LRLQKCGIERVLKNGGSLWWAGRVSSHAAVRVRAQITGSSEAAVMRPTSSSTAVTTAQLCTPSLHVVWLLMADLGQANGIGNNKVEYPAINHIAHVLVLFLIQRQTFPKRRVRY
jgi:hypothetical protein